MGLLSSGTPLQWAESKPYLKQVKHEGVTQFLNAYHSAKHFRNHSLKWGDEVEYMLIQVNPDAEQAKLSLRGFELIEELQREEHAVPEGSSVPCLWRPEYARWMIEGTPGMPYRCYAADLALVERNMALRRAEITKLLKPDEVVLTLTAFPRQGCGEYTVPKTLPYGRIARSFHTSDGIINPHPRFGTLSRNVRQRRGSQVEIEMPVYMDKHTTKNQPLISTDPAHQMLLEEVEARIMREGGDGKDIKDSQYVTLQEAKSMTVGPNIRMDSTAFGMGCCCLQVTIQGRDIHESRYLYDQLAVMAPLMLALTAATPAVRGMLADTDARWDIIAASCDDRTPQEIETKSVLKSRYSSIDCYISDMARFKPEQYNDLPIPMHKEVYERLRAGDVDHLLAQHIAHLYIRDPVVIYKEKMDQDNETSMDHFENIQSTNWNTVRFKPPPPGTDIGWRTEFRSMEVGLTDFENAAFSVFVVILSRVIVAFNLNFYMPMSLVDQNMDAAHERNAASSREFHFRKNVFTSSGGSGFLCECGHIHNASLVGGQSKCEDIDKFCRDPEKDASDSDTDSHELMTLDEIFNGKRLRCNGQVAGFQFPGLIPLMRGYLDSIKIDSATHSLLVTYLDFVSERASGKLCTTATYIRNFVIRHPAYSGDSVISEQICHDLITTCRGVTDGDINAPELFGRFYHDRLAGDIDTPEDMMRRMKRNPVEAEDGLLLGSSLPSHALDTAIEALARGRLLRRGGGPMCKV